MPATLTKEGDALVLDLSTARGTEFQDSLAKIKEVPGRRYDPENKLWKVPADAGTADRVIHALEPIVSEELLDWVKLERVRATENLTTPIPDDAELQCDLGDAMYGFQRAFVAEAVRAKAIINADDMGLGKTVMALGTVEEYRHRVAAYAVSLCHDGEREEGAPEGVQQEVQGEAPREGAGGRTSTDGSLPGKDSSHHSFREVEALYRLWGNLAARGYGPGSRPGSQELLVRALGGLSAADWRNATGSHRSGTGEVRRALPELSQVAALVDGPKLIVCPNSVKGVWAREVNKWLPGQSYQIIDGTTPKSRHNQLLKAINENAFVIVNYEQLRVQKATYEVQHRNGTKSKEAVEVLKEPLFELPFLAAAEVSLDDLDARTVMRARNSKHRKDWFAAIADEAHRAKNRRASQTKGLHRVRAELKLAQTGTPIMNTPDELWSLLHWLYPNEYTSYWDFYETYVEYTEGYWGKVITGVRNPDALRFELRGRLVRRTKALLDLPEKTRVIVPVELSSSERKFYDEVLTQVWLDLKSEAEDNDVLANALAQGTLASLLKIPNGAARMVRCQQVLEHPANIEAERVKDSSKMDACQEIILDNPQEQHVVFCAFKQTVAIFAERLREKGLNVGTYTGDTPPAVRTSLEDQFQRSEIDVLVGTIDAMKEGITLTAASIGHFLTRKFVPAPNEQAEDRLHRNGQHDPVTIYIYEVPDSVDDGKVSPTLRTKEAIVSTVLTKDEVKERKSK